MSLADDMLIHRRYLLRYAFSFTRNLDDAEDLVQTTFVKALTGEATFAAGTNLRAWLTTILRNAFLTQLRRKGAQGVEDITAVADQHLRATPSQLDALEVLDLAGALSMLPPAVSEALLLAAEGYSYDFIARKQGLALGTVKSRMSRARELAQRMVEGTAGPVKKVRSPRLVLVPVPHKPIKKSDKPRAAPHRKVFVKKSDMQPVYKTTITSHGFRPQVRVVMSGPIRIRSMTLIPRT